MEKNEKIVQTEQNDEFILTTGEKLTLATEDQIAAGNKKIFIPADGFKKDDIITFSNDLKLYNQTYPTLKDEFTNEPVSALVLPCTITRTIDGVNTTLHMSVAVNTLLGQAYKEANPLKALAKNHYFNEWIQERLSGKDPLKQIVEIVKGTSFKILRPEFHQVEKWVDVLDENGQPIIKANGRKSKQPYTREEARGVIIPTKIKKALCLTSN